LASASHVLPAVHLPVRLLLRHFRILLMFTITCLPSFSGHKIRTEPDISRYFDFLYQPIFRKPGLSLIPFSAVLCFCKPLQS
jgi:hypothetical protein